jgi:phosphate uptake regulator
MVGRGGYIISLPKEWVQKLGIEKGNEIAFKVKDDSSLILTPDKILEKAKESEKTKQKEYYIEINQKGNPQSLYRKIISFYVTSADILHICSKSKELSYQIRKSIKNLVKNVLLGAEIVNESQNEIEIKTLINHPDFPIEKAIRRMAILALSANKEVILELNRENRKSFQNIEDTFNDISRLNLYVIRQLKYGLEQNLYKELGFNTIKEFLGYRIIVNDIQSIAKNALNIMNKIVNLEKLIENKILFLKKSIDEEMYSQISDLTTSVHELYEKSLNSMFKRDYEQADRIISELESFVSLENNLTTSIFTKKQDPHVASVLLFLLDNSKRIIECIQNVAEVTLNRTVEETISLRTY